MNLIDFLKTYTKINNEFIDDFFGLYDTKDKYNFSINIDVIAKWFNMTIGHIKETLVYSYKEKIDYKIIKGVSNGMKGKPKETILLTPKCFKLMAMQSKTKKAIQVREYYYELEQVIDQYKEYIIKGLEEKINIATCHFFNESHHVEMVRLTYTKENCLENQNTLITNLQNKSCKVYNHKSKKFEATNKSQHIDNIIHYRKKDVEELSETLKNNKKV